MDIEEVDSSTGVALPAEITEQLYAYARQHHQHPAAAAARLLGERLRDWNEAQAPLELPNFDAMTDEQLQAWFDGLSRDRLLVYCDRAPDLVPIFRLARSRPVIDDNADNGRKPPRVDLGSDPLVLTEICLPLPMLDQIDAIGGKTMDERSAVIIAALRTFLSQPPGEA